MFTEDIPGQAKKYDIKEVTLGYYRNYLSPKRLAKLATKEDIKNLKELQEKTVEAKKERIKNLTEQKAKLKSLTLKFEEKADDKGKLFGSVSEESIKEKLTKEGFDVASIVIDNPIKKVGKHKVEVVFPEGIKGVVKLEVVSK